MPSQDEAPLAVQSSAADWADPDAPARGSRLFLASVCLVASLGGFLFGFDTAVISGTFGFVERQFGLSKIAVGWFGSAALVGCILGAMVAGWLGDRFGRKPVLISGGAMFFFSALYTTIPNTFSMLIAARIVGGVGVGFASVLAPIYISEFAPPKIRGRLAALFQLSIVIGILLAYTSNWALVRFSETHPAAFGGVGFLHRAMVSEVWRGMFATLMLPNLLFVLLLLFVPESPRWLIENNRLKRGFTILARVGGRETALAEMADIREAAANEEGSLRELLKPGLRLALIAGTGLAVFSQLTGVNTIVYYGPTILQKAGLKVGGALQYQVALGFINLIFTLIAIWKVDTWGRRALLLRGMSGVTVALAIIATLFALNLGSSIWLVVAMGAFMACVSVSICGVIWVILPEIFPNRVRGRAMSITVFAVWATNAVIAFFFPWFVNRFGMHIGFFTFSGICLIATVFFWRMVPETKGRSLEEIERYWLKKGRAAENL
jgi:SP family arabinose:H+ symporter-like MFS transporter